jgi:misacylated tRNA(Ala) deacylase
MSTALLFREDAYLRTAEAQVTAVSERGIELDRTVFYPQGGGQAGDSGTLLRPDGSKVFIRDTRKGNGPDAVLHLVDAGAPLPAPGERVALELDWPRRHRLMRLHTALHLLSCVITAPVTGGNIAPDKARLDFDIDLALLNAAHIEQQTNALITTGTATETLWITDAELAAQPELVKTMSVQPPQGAGRVRLLKIPGIDLQPCGGTHVANLGEIGPIRVLRIRSEGKRNKRVEIALSDNG